MKDKKEFYIGWQNGMSPSTKKFLIAVISGIGISALLIVFLVVYFQKSFNDHDFEFGNIREFTGIYHSTPVPRFTITDEIPDGISPYALLVGYGKFGAEGIVWTIAREGVDLEGRKLKIRGTLIYGDGQTLIELTEKEQFLVEVLDDEERPPELDNNLVSSNIQGEIIDPKCYFGVMKPGEGKVHKSCAIRCISGGIPPVLKADFSPVEEIEYFVILGDKDLKINRDILEYVGEDVLVKGNVKVFDNWGVIYTTPESIEYR